MKNISKETKQIPLWGKAVFIVFLLSIGVMTYNSKMNAASRQLITLSKKVKVAYAKENSFGGLDTDTAIKKGIIPQKMLNSESVVSSLGLPVLVGWGENGKTLSSGMMRFNIIYKDLNKEQCIKLANFEHKEIVAIDIINASRDGVCFRGCDLIGPSKKAEEACKEKNTIIWSFVDFK